MSKQKRSTFQLNMDDETRSKLEKLCAQAKPPTTNLSGMVRTLIWQEAKRQKV